MHTYRRIIISLHTYITFGPLPRFVHRLGARAGFNTILTTRFGLPVRTHVLKRRFGPPVYTSLFGVPPRPHSAPLGEGAVVFGALAAETVQNGLFFEAAAEKDVASEAQNPPAPGGPGASQTFCFQVFLNNETHPGSASRKSSKSCGGPKVRKQPFVMKRGYIFANVVFYNFESRVVSPKQ